MVARGLIRWKIVSLIHPYSREWTETSVPYSPYSPYSPLIPLIPPPKRLPGGTTARFGPVSADPNQDWTALVVKLG